MYTIGCEFTKEGSIPYSAKSRPILFALRNQVREQIQGMLKYGDHKIRHLRLVYD